MNEINSADVLEKKITQLEEENKKLKKKYEDLKTLQLQTANQVEFYAALYNGVINARWWKTTAPLRKAADLLRNVKVIRYSVKALKILFRNGPRTLFATIKAKKRSNKKVCSFEISRERRKNEEKTAFERNAKISVLVPLYNTPIEFLKEMIESVENQTYKNWELCLADGSDDFHTGVGEFVLLKAQKDKRIVYKKLEKNLGISENTNACIDMATGDYISLFDHDDLLHPSALFFVAKEIEKNADFIYTDEVTFLNGNVKDLVNLHYKPDFAIDTLRSYNYICHLTTFKKSLLEKTGGFRKECDGSQDYDLILRLVEQAEKIVHVPEILYFWRGHKNSTAQDIGSKPYIINAAHKALRDHLERVGLKGTVTDAVIPSTYRIKYDIEGNPLVSIVIANKDNIDVLDVCVKSIFEKSTYKNFEIIIVENNSTQNATFEYYKELEEKYSNVKIAYWKDKFNYSAINNFGFTEAEGDYVLLLNNDIEVITPSWIEEMLMFAQRKDVGAVGAMLYYPDDTIQHAGVIIGIGGVAGHAHKYFPRGTYGYMSRGAISQNYSAVTFACVMMSSDVFEEMHGIDEKFEVAFNDVDMCMRLRRAGYLNVFTPYAELYHHESKSRGQEDTPEKIKRFNSEIDRFQKRWGKELKKGDPFYNPHLTLHHEDFSFKNE